MTPELPKGHSHNCRVYRPMGLTDASVKFLEFITTFGLQAQASSPSMRVYDRNFEIMLATPHMFNAPSRWNDTWPRIATNAVLQAVVSRAPETCAAPATLQPHQAVWLANYDRNPSDRAPGTLALSFKDPNVTHDESTAFAKVIGELSGGKVLTKDSAGMLVFASSVPRNIGTHVVDVINTKLGFMTEPFTFEPANYLGPRPRPR